MQLRWLPCSLAIAAVAVTPPAQQDTAPLQISGVYPHLTTYGVYSQNGAHDKEGHNECGIGAVVPWAGRLWMINYAPHRPRGSEHKLFSVATDLQLTVHPESVGGTPAARMIHRESNQLLIGPYLIDANGRVRVISPQVMPGRLTAIARHLKDPANLVYYIDMEGMIYEADVHSLEVKLLFEKPVPGWHGKGGYTAQGRLVVSNNGEHAAGTYAPLLVGGAPKSDEEAGVLAEWVGGKWHIVERKQYTDVTGPGGIFGASSGRTPLWAIGWDRRSLRLKLLDRGRWYTYLLPKATHNNDPRHGWYTEWPRIREVGHGKLLMDMHGMFFDFPKTFSAANTAGLRPIASHLRYVPDFCEWNGRLVLATDETSIQGNPLAGQPQSNLWFGQLEDLESWGPASGFGGPWVGDAVQADTPSDPFLIAGFDRRVLHLVVGRGAKGARQHGLRASDQQAISNMPDSLALLPRVTIDRGDWHRPAPKYAFVVNRPVTVYFAVDQRGEPELGPEWSKTGMGIGWGQGHRDVVYRRTHPAGTVEIPGNATEHGRGAFGMPHMALVQCAVDDLEIRPLGDAKLTRPARVDAEVAGPVRFTLELDANGHGRWQKYTTLDVGPGGYAFHVVPGDLNAEWMRISADRDCVATAYFHLTDADHRDPAAASELFAGLADAGAANAISGLVYAAKRNRNLRTLDGRGRSWEFGKSDFTFAAADEDRALDALLAVKPEFSIDAASVILETNAGRLRLPKGVAAFDRPFASGWPRGSREVESERHLANFHGTFYEVPLLTNGQPPAFHLMRPVASHGKHITDFCTWNGLLVLAGVRQDATLDGHVFRDPGSGTGLWFGGIDDLWKLGKPVGDGGPWKDHTVTAGEPSDPYLMTGYDQKSLSLCADRDVVVTVEVDIDHQSGWHHYTELRLRAGEERTHEFPAEFSVHWIRFTTNRDCTATAWLRYQ